MHAAALHLFRLQRADELHAHVAKLCELVLQLLRRPRAVVPLFGDRDAVPCLELRLGLVEDVPDPAREPVLLGLDHVPDHLVDAPLVWGRPPRRHLWRESLERRGEPAA